MTYAPQILAPDQLRWDLPGQAWSGADRYDETIKIIYDNGSWSGVTECNQCVHRDLGEDEIASVRKEFGLDAQIQG